MKMFNFWFWFVVVLIISHQSVVDAGFSRPTLADLGAHNHETLFMKGGLSSGHFRAKILMRCSQQIIMPLRFEIADSYIPLCFQEKGGLSFVRSGTGTIEHSGASVRLDRSMPLLCLMKSQFRANHSQSKIVEMTMPKTAICYPVSNNQFIGARIAQCIFCSRIDHYRSDRPRQAV